MDENDPRMGERGSARWELWWALWDNYTPNTKAALIDNLLAEYDASRPSVDPVDCPNCN